MRLVNSPESGNGGGARRVEHSLERANYIIELYGIHALLADIDAGREYWRESDDGGESIIHSCLDWLMDEGFAKFFDQFDLSWPHTSRLQWQQRYMIAMWKA
jgi:hypothetical protein